VTISSSNTYGNYPPWQGQAATDHDGLTRPQSTAYDIGAYEYYSGSGSAKPNPPTNLKATVQ
jgi:hypothetical protein